MYTCDHAGFAPNEKKNNKMDRVEGRMATKPTNYDNSLNYKLYKLLCG
jgi:hypothetical protein